MLERGGEEPKAGNSRHIMSIYTITLKRELLGGEESNRPKGKATTTTTTATEATTESSQQSADDISLLSCDWLDCICDSSPNGKGLPSDKSKYGSERDREGRLWDLSLLSPFGRYSY